MNLQLLNYKINKINYALNPAKAGQQMTYAIKPEITYKLKVNAGQIGVECIFNLETKEEAPTPFDINIVLIASFKINSEATVAEYHTDINTQLFPYLRSAIAQITLQSNIPAYNLPFLNAVSVQGATASSKPTGNAKGDIVITPLEEL